IADERFAFDTEGSQAVASFDELMQRVAQGGGGVSGGGAGGQAAMQGGGGVESDDGRRVTYELRRFEGGLYRSEDETAEVVILSFWTSWARPCVQTLAELQEVEAWARAAGHPVA